MKPFLDEYHRKRSFAKTPEPSGSVEPDANGWRFVVQKHQAAKLHYDLRLELEGVLKSWAIPKGPSLNPENKRLAVHVEDHPLAYLHFEGVIPQGEYGGGTVLVWDIGTWEPINHDGYQSGGLKFRLHGHKLQGQWMLVHTGKRKKSAAERRQWLLFKERDESARGDEVDVLRDYPDSVLSHRTLAEITASPAAVWTAADTRRAAATMPAPTKRSSDSREKLAPGHVHQQASRTKPHRAATKRSMPKQIDPAIPRAAKTPPLGGEWHHEVKFDGYRMLAFAGDGKVRLVSRNGKDWTDRLPRMAARLQQFTTRNCILDGEVVSLAPDGTTSFQSLQNTIGRGDDRTLSYCLFDLLYLDGYDLRQAPLEDRRALLAELLTAAGDPAFLYSAHLEAEGALVFEKAAHLGAEGIVSKRKGSAYPRGRTDLWVKTKCVRCDAFVVGGYTLSTTDRRALGALIVGRYEDGALVYEGRVGTGFSDATQDTLLAALADIESEDSPFCNLELHDLTNFRPVRPTLVVEVEYGGWTTDRRLRFPIYRGLRDDRCADAIQRGEAELTNFEPAMSAATVAALEEIRFTHPDRVMVPALGVTKLGLATYYAEVVDWILPHISNRPLAVIRYPKGLGQQSFFQKSRPAGMPASVRALDHGGKKALLVRDLAGLLALVQFSALEIHAWGARADRPDKPDRMVLDLDPDPSVPFSRVAEAAHEVRSLLSAVDLQCFVMTTGGKGLHVTMPLRRTSSWQQVKEFAKAIATAMAVRSPGRFTTSPSKAARRGKIYVDFLRNGKGATAIAPYSTRAQPSGSVAAPIFWKEVDVLASAASFSIMNLRRRLATLEDDPWAAFFEVRQSLTTARMEKVKELGKVGTKCR